MKNIFIFCFIALLLAGCSERERGTETTGTNTSQDTVAVIKPIVKVYIENSGSMDGYVKGVTDFKDAIGKLLTKLKYHYDKENVKIFFINNDEKEKLRIENTTTDTNIGDFANYIDLNWKKYKRGNNTNLNNIFKEILARTDSNTLSILFSDCIYSVGNGSTINLLNYEKHTTMDAFLEKSKENNGNLATIIVKMKSKFDGFYYPYTGDNKKFHFNGELPYYICVIANQTILADFNKNIKLKEGEIMGFDNKYIISAGSANDFYYSVLLSTDNIGRFKANRKASTKEYVHAIENVNTRSLKRRKENDSNKFAFAVAVDLKNIPVEEDYLLNSENYTLSNANFQVKEIKLVDKNKISANDWLRISVANPTHIIILEATGTAMSHVKVALKKQMPQWIENSNIIDDTDKEKLKGNKTFGLKYWIEGITEAYQEIYPNDKSFFEFEIKINN
jgi:hypothetical protein